MFDQEGITTVTLGVHTCVRRTSACPHLLMASLWPPSELQPSYSVLICWWQRNEKPQFALTKESPRSRHETSGGNGGSEAQVGIWGHHHVPEVYLHSNNPNWTWDALRDTFLFLTGLRRNNTDRPDRPLHTFIALNVAVSLLFLSLYIHRFICNNWRLEHITADLMFSVIWLIIKLV